MDLQKNVNANLSLNHNWATLPANILDEILVNLVLGDCVRFAAVCAKWRSTCLEERNYRGNQKIPMVMLPNWLNDDKAEFYSVINERTLEFLPPLPYPKRFIGSSFGWLISVDTNFAITLFDPFSSAKDDTSIRLPPVINSDLMSKDGNFDFEKLDHCVFNHEYYFVKAIFSVDPAFHPDDYVVMLIYGKSRRLAFIRPGDNKGWVYFNDTSSLSGLCDITYSCRSKSNFKSKHRGGFFYTLQSSGVVYRINIEAKDTRIDCFAPSLDFESPYDCDVRYIVESSCSGELLQVVRLMERIRGTNTTYSFKVFKLENSDYWVELKSLGNDVLFVGDGSSLSVMITATSASKSPTRCQRGSVYFLPPFRQELLVESKPFKLREGSNDMGWGNIETEMKEPFQIMYNHSFSTAILNRPPIWFVPTSHEAARVKQ